MCEKNALINKDLSILETIQEIEEVNTRGGEPGIAVVDKNRRVLGVVTDGDIRKAVAQNIDLNISVSNIMTKDPIKIIDSDDLTNSIKKAIDEMSNRNIKISKLVKVNHYNEYLDILNLNRSHSGLDFHHRDIMIYGMGYVGLTLALKIAETKNYNVIGIDKNELIIENLKKYTSFF